MPEEGVSAKSRFPYFKGDEAEQFSFYRVPKALFTHEVFSEISTDAKMLYGLLLDRMDLSVKNKWIDESGHAYIYFTIETVQEKLSCGNKKAVRLMKELEDVGLIERRKQFNRQPDVIYVKKFFSGVSKQHDSACQNDIPCDVISSSSGMSKQHRNHTEYNNTELNQTDLIVSAKGGCDGMRTRTQYEAYFRERLSVDHILTEYPYEAEKMKEIVGLIVDVCMSGAKTIRISGDEKPTNIVRAQFMKLNQFHVSYVLKCMQENGTKIRNIKQYILAALYNAPFTMEHYYQAWVNNDMADGKI